MAKDFQLVILAGYTTKDQMIELVNNGIPHCKENFEIKIVVD